MSIPKDKEHCVWMFADHAEALAISLALTEKFGGGVKLYTDSVEEMTDPLTVVTKSVSNVEVDPSSIRTNFGPLFNATDAEILATVQGFIWAMNYLMEMDAKIRNMTSNSWSKILN